MVSLGIPGEERIVSLYTLRNILFSSVVTIFFHFPNLKSTFLVRYSFLPAADPAASYSVQPLQGCNITGYILIPWLHFVYQGLFIVSPFQVSNNALAIDASTLTLIHRIVAKSLSC